MIWCTVVFDLVLMRAVVGEMLERLQRLVM